MAAKKKQKEWYWNRGGKERIAQNKRERKRKQELQKAREQPVTFLKGYMMHRALESIVSAQRALRGLEKSLKEKVKNQ